jgi:uncharacterized protein
MRLRRAIVSLALVALPVAAQQSESSPPILDVQLRVSAPGAFGRPSPGFCPAQAGETMPTLDSKSNTQGSQNPTCPNHLSAAETDEELGQQTLAILKEYNIIAVAMLLPAQAKQWQSAEPKRIIPGFFFAADQKFDRSRIDAQRTRGEFTVLGEAVTPHEGFSPSDPDWDRYLAMAEELDIPLGIQIGLEPPGAANFFATAKYADQYGDPLVLAEALARHPRLRAYVLHAGWPHVEGMIALMSAHPQLYADISVIDWYLPREEFHKYLRRLVEAGFAKRIIFGSDEMIWPDAIKLAIGAVASADFLSPKQKRDILYNNAAKFLRFDPARMTVQ